jgi:hypothetical protein
MYYSLMEEKKSYCPLQIVICYIEVPFKAGLTVYTWISKKGYECT